MDASLTTSQVERKLIEAYITLPPISSGDQVKTDGWWEWQTRVLCVPLLCCLLCLSHPAAFCVIHRGPFMCRMIAWTGPGRSQVTAGWESHLSSLLLTTMAAECERWLSISSDGWRLLSALKRRIWGEREDGLLYCVFLCGWRFDAAGVRYRWYAWCIVWEENAELQCDYWLRD